MLKIHTRTGILKSPHETNFSERLLYAEFYVVLSALYLLGGYYLGVMLMFASSLHLTVAVLLVSSRLILGYWILCF